MKHQNLFAICTTIVLFGYSTTIAQDAGKPLAYTFPQGHKFSYEFEINIDAGDSTISYKGITNYTVESATEKQLRLTYQGGLNESSKPKDPRRSSGIPFGSRGYSIPPSFPSIFGRQNFLGKSQTTNHITLTPQGHVLTLDGSSQLPYLLGNVSLIPFEPLPKNNAKQWSSGSGVSITEQADDRRFPYRPFGPLVMQNSESIQAASESTEYEIKSSQEHLVVVSKKYELSTPDTGDRESFQMNGSGTWTLDTTDGVPSSSEMKFSLAIKDRNTTTTFPIDLKFTRITAERRRQMDAETKAAAEKFAKIDAERKAAAEAPLSEQETTALISDLKSGDNFKVHSTLNMLSMRTPKDPNPKLAEAIRSHLNGSIAGASHSADRALRNFDPVYRLNKEYEGPHHIPSSNLPVTDSTELYVGQIVQVREHGSQWWAADVSELPADGKVVIKYRGWGGHRAATLSRNNLQLAPKQVAQPPRPAKTVGSPKPGAKALLEAKMRTWSDASGSFKVEAAYMGVSDGKVVLRRADNREVSVPILRLSLDDQRYITQMREAAKELGNPFEPTEPK